MKFWDSSAVLPLIVEEPTSALMKKTLRTDPVMIVWWGTLVECTSAVAIRERHGDLSMESATRVLNQLRALSAGWNEMSASDAVRALATRLLRLHSLRAADALQLAAALVAAEDDPTSLEFLSLDDKLKKTAQLHGFRTELTDDTAGNL